MRKRLGVILGLIAAIGLMAACEPATTTLRPRMLLLGDSLTGQYGPHLATDAWPKTRVLYRWWPGTNPVATSWLGWLNNVPGRLDTVVFEDYTGACCDEGGFDQTSYTAAVQAISDAVHARNARFIVLDTAVHPDLSGVTGIDAIEPMAPPDDPDGVHYLNNGAELEAEMLAARLGIPITVPVGA